MTTFLHFSKKVLLFAIQKREQKPPTLSSLEGWAACRSHSTVEPCQVLPRINVSSHEVDYLSLWFTLMQDGRALFAELITLAEEQPPKNLKEASFKIGHRMDLHRFIVPVQVRGERERWRIWGEKVQIVQTDRATLYELETQDRSGRVCLELVRFSTRDAAGKANTESVFPHSRRKRQPTSTVTQASRLLELDSSYTQGRQQQWQNALFPILHSLLFRTPPLPKHPPPWQRRDSP